eukprot:TRINITY_DN10952_c0_g1_i3.p1 TRINITY_DN10952_c0_g1~~TRINITY_DN10952_c0_g1_i3.p1  ORF type:complete len:409 (+),score=56.98 TRINITY_DN10952_c0_g1_i3:117-1343(+)
MDWLRSLITGRDDESSERDQAFPTASTKKLPAGIPPIVLTRADDLASQGFLRGATDTASLLHISTSPKSYFVSKYGSSASEGINMDRGGFGSAPDGTHVAVVYDGVSAGGAVNAHAAQAFSRYTLKWLCEHKDILSPDPAELEKQLRQLFDQATSYQNNPGGDHQAEGGSATAVVASFRRQPGPDVKFQLIGGYVGDAACIVLHPNHGGQLLTKSRRREDNPSDTGGQLMMCMGISGRVAPLVHTVTPGSLVLLTTDGLTDNVDRRDFDVLLLLIVESTFFQEPVPDPICLKYPTRLPDYEELFNLTRKSKREELPKVSCQDAARRLGHYVQWVTRALNANEDRFYKLSHEYEQYRKQGKTDCSRAQALEHELEKLVVERQHSKLAGKTDDCLFCVLKPYYSAVALKK